MKAQTFYICLWIMFLIKTIDWLYAKTSSEPEMINNHSHEILKINLWIYIRSKFLDLITYLVISYSCNEIKEKFLKKECPIFSC